MHTTYPHGLTGLPGLLSQQCAWEQTPTDGTSSRNDPPPGLATEDRRAFEIPTRECPPGVGLSQSPSSGADDRRLRCGIRGEKDR